jgi:DNA repair protein RadD
MLMVTYYGALSDKPVNEYLTVMHDGYAGQKARVSLVKIASNAGVHGVTLDNQLDDVAFDLNKATPPALIKFRQDGKFYRVTDRRWG